MPYDRELHFGYVGPDKVFEFADRVGVPMCDHEGLAITLESFRANPNDGADFDTNRFDAALRRAFIGTIESLGWEHGKVTLNGVIQNNPRYIGVMSPWGAREAGVWRLQAIFDPNEMGDTPEQLTLGVNLSSRYFPSIIDMEDQHGTIGPVLTFDKALFDKIEVCKRELIKEIPELYDAEVFLRDKFY